MDLISRPGEYPSWKIAEPSLPVDSIPTKPDLTVSIAANKSKDWACIAFGTLNVAPPGSFSPIYYWNTMTGTSVESDYSTVLQMYIFYDDDEDLKEIEETEIIWKDISSHLVKTWSPDLRLPQKDKAFIITATKGAETVLPAPVA